MRAFIAFYIPSCGGGERVALEAARSLSESGLDVTFVVNSREALDSCRERFAVPVKYGVIEVGSVVERVLGLGGRFVRLRNLLVLKKIISKISEFMEEGITIDMRLNHPSKLHVSYIHYPLSLTTYLNTGRLYGVYNWYVKRMLRSIEGRPRLVMTNSRWTAQVVKKIYGLDGIPVYPPVDVDFFRYDGTKKEKIIVTVSRISFEKNVHLIPRIASKLPDYTWYLVGSMGIGRGERRLSEKAIEAIYREAEKHGARNIEVLPDLPRAKLRDLLLRATFYVNPLYVEHFGIAVAEAMAAGAIPIVYRDGGAWSDIVSPVSEKLGYGDVEDIPRIVRSIEENESLMNTLRERAIARANEFRPEIFRERFIGLLRQHNLI